MHTAVCLAAEHDTDVQRLREYFHLPRPTIKALTSQFPTDDQSNARFRQPRSRRNPSIDDVADYIDQLIAENSAATIWSIWKKLIHDRQITASYGTVRDYVNRVLAHPDQASTFQHLVSRATLFATIRDAATGIDLVIRLATQFSTDPATVRRALLEGWRTSLASKKSKRNPSLEGLRHHIDEMLANDQTSPSGHLGTTHRRARRRSVLRHRPGLHLPRAPSSIQLLSENLSNRIPARANWPSRTKTGPAGTAIFGPSLIDHTSTTVTLRIWSLPGADARWYR
jgi:hypothetical protein